METLADTQYSWFHIIFALAAMYVAGLLTDWAVISTSPVAHPAPETTPGYNVHILRHFRRAEPDVYIGRSEATMWMRIVSSWICYALYTWSL